MRPRHSRWFTTVLQADSTAPLAICHRPRIILFRNMWPKSCLTVGISQTSVWP
jgi:hypothetical protein